MEGRRADSCRGCAPLHLHDFGEDAEGFRGAGAEIWRADPDSRGGDKKRTGGERGKERALAGGLSRQARRAGAGRARGALRVGGRGRPQITGCAGRGLRAQPFEQHDAGERRGARGGAARGGGTAGAGDRRNGGKQQRPEYDGRDGPGGEAAEGDADGSARVGRPRRRGNGDDRRRASVAPGKGDRLAGTREESGLYCPGARCAACRADVRGVRADRLCVEGQRRRDGGDRRKSGDEGAARADAGGGQNNRKSQSVREEGGGVFAIRTGSADYFSRASLRWRTSLKAVVRRVSGIFLLVVRSLRSKGLRSGSMCRETSKGVLGLFIRLRTTV